MFKSVTKISNSVKELVSWFKYFYSHNLAVRIRSTFASLFKKEPDSLLTDKRLNKG